MEKSPAFIVASVYFCKDSRRLGPSPRCEKLSLLPASGFSEEGGQFFDFKIHSQQDWLYDFDKNARCIRVGAYLRQSGCMDKSENNER